jgi:hypothetical protein
MGILETMRAGWIGTIRDFLGSDRQAWVESLENHLQSSLGETASQSNRAAWLNCHRVLKDQLGQFVTKRPDVPDWGIAFEYELPRERGRRVDVAILAGESVVLLEFKDSHDTLQAHVDQVAAYARDLSSYQAASHNRSVVPVLVKTLSDEEPVEFGQIWITGASGLCACIERTGVSGEPWTSISDWIDSPYAPLPSLVRAARMIFAHEPLPRIKQAESAGVGDAVAALAAIIEEARSKSERHIVFVTGVPGAGKTLTGLQLVYTLTLKDEDDRAIGVFLSGNGPLVAVLQYALKGKPRAFRLQTDPSRVFVRDVLAFVRDHIGPEAPLPPEHVWVYDEAQRAWDADMVAEKHRCQMSEPEMFLRLGERMRGWSVMVGLIGSGQEIFRGEEGGMEQWNEALKKMPSSWTVHCPALDAQSKPLAQLLTAAASIKIDEALSLNRSLRSRLALDLPEWTNSLLAGDVARAASFAPTIRSAGFNLYITGDVEAAKDYARSRYEGNEDARYGLLASNKDRSLPRFNVRNDYPVQRNLKNHVGPFFVDSPESKRSCCQFRDVATPFECQGLELDFPIICWGDDLWWDGKKWATRKQRNSKELDPYQLRINGYRVLLSRGRDGMTIFVPPIERLRETYRVLIDAGCQELA